MAKKIIKKSKVKKTVIAKKKPVTAAKKAVKQVKKNTAAKPKSSGNPSKNVKIAAKTDVKVSVKPMPEDGKPISKSEFGEYKDKLLKLKEEILGQIKEISEDSLSKSQTEATGENSAYTLDAATDNYDREFNFRLVSGDRELLLEIDSALRKIDGGDYGICIVCDKPIGKSRLSVIPYARHCRQCKEQLEKEGKL